MRFVIVACAAMPLAACGTSREERVCIARDAADEAGVEAARFAREFAQDQALDPPVAAQLVDQVRAAAERWTRRLVEEALERAENIRRAKARAIADAVMLGAVRLVAAVAGLPWYPVTIVKVKAPAPVVVAPPHR